MSLDGGGTLSIQWINGLGDKWGIRSVNGEFGGCIFALQDNRGYLSDDGWTGLKGRVSVDFNRLSSLLPLQMAEGIKKLKLNSLFAIEGDFWINSDYGKSFFDTLSFKGKLLGNEAVIKGYQLKKVQADLQYIPNRLDVQNFIVEDPAVSVKVPSGVVAFDQNEDCWGFSFPQVEVRNLKPSLLRDTETSSPMSPKFRSLIVKKIDFQNLKGNVDEVSTWQAEGSLQFLNSSRKNALQALFAIPAEILLRVGLDPQVLNPVKGMVFFDLQGDRFYLRRFRDVFSEGRGSKFYLVGPNPSWIDFDGNLSVNIRMKHYNLIFKITELFTFSIHGNIKKPLYGLQRQPKVSRKGRSAMMRQV